MRRTRQIPLQDRLSAMIRFLSGVLAAAMVFSLVFFSPLIDMDDTIAAAAQSRDWGGRGDRGERGDRSERSERGDRGERSERSESSERSERGERSERSEPSERSDNSDNDSDNEASETSNNSSQEANSGNSATQKSGSGGFLGNVFGNSQFAGDSEPSGGSLTKREEREAIQNGWR